MTYYNYLLQTNRASKVKIINQITHYYCIIVIPYKEQSYQKVCVIIATYDMPTCQRVTLV